MIEVNSFVYCLIESNFPKLKNWAQVKCNPVIRFKDLHDVRWKYLPKKYRGLNTVVERK